MTFHRRLFITVAILLSLCVHVGVLCWFGVIHVGPLAIPADAGRTIKPFHLKRVEIPAQSLVEVPPPPIAPPPAPVPSKEAPPAVLPEAAQTLPQSLQAAPAPVLPQPQPGSPAAFAPVVPAPPAASSPYALDDRAAIEAEISKAAVGPKSPGLPAALPSTPALPGTLPADATQPAGQLGTGTLPSAAALPSLEEVSANFRVTPPTLNPSIPQPVVLTLPTDILFDFDSSALRSGAEPLLRQALAYFRRYPRAEIEVDGHTDSFGAADYNQTLSEARAAAVQAWLRPQLPEGAYAITAKGFGATRPVVDPHGNVAAQQKNRRVEIVLRALASDSR
ncbi:MAG: OmpA family protein [Verrucomicrobium sp.]|nr:OmpA family protein [Verrucomicrobium sp.]